MAKKKQHIDNFFKDRLTDQELQMDGSEWTRLAKELQPKNKRRFIWWWWLGFALLVSGITGLLIYQANTVKTNVTTSSGDSLESEETIEASQSSTLDSYLDPDTVLQAEVSTAATQTDLNKPKGQINSNASADKSSHVNTVNKNKLVKNADAQMPKNAGKLIKTNAVSIINTDEYPSVKSIDLKEIPYTIDLSLDSLPEKLNKTSPFIAKPKPQFRPVYVGAMIHLQSNQQNLAGDSSAYVALRNQNEFAAISSSYHLGVKARFNQWNYATGFSLLTQKQNLGSAYNHTGTLNIRLYDSIPVLDINGDTISFLPYNFRDSVLVSQNAPQASYLTVPLAFGRSFDINTKLSIGINAQLSPKFLLSSSGAINHPSIGKLDYATGNLKRFGLTGGINIDMNYVLKGPWMFSLNAGWNTDLLNTANLPGTKQRFNLYHGGIGLYYRIK